jgi:hypothetical protein
MRLGLFDDPLEAAEQLQEHRHRGVVHGDWHGTVLLIFDDVDAARILTGRKKGVKGWHRPPFGAPAVDSPRHDRYHTPELKKNNGSAAGTGGMERVSWRHS